ncbi:retrotransposon gag protein [Metarhizium robertsii]|uniref:Retrotransposon gag protein n=1 Tax=Metarhizium robertsii TaxID=568076 RepID=A0A014P2I2_9HYPO|nr:retrotransposon gag protein [Metarhizium robertsii]
MDPLTRTKLQELRLPTRCNLQDYDEFKTQLKRAFELDDDAQKLQAARQLAGLHEKGSVQEYALRFSGLADQAGINDQTKVVLFSKGFKPRIREGLIIYIQTVREATRNDSQLYYSGKQARKDGMHRRGKDG